jgi:hypothetical protein
MEIVRKWSWILVVLIWQTNRILKTKRFMSESDTQVGDHLTRRLVKNTTGIW